MRSTSAYKPRSTNVCISVRMTRMKASLSTSSRFSDEEYLDHDHAMLSVPVLATLEDQGFAI